MKSDAEVICEWMRQAVDCSRTRDLVEVENRLTLVQWVAYHRHLAKKVKVRFSSKQRASALAAVLREERG